MDTMTYEPTEAQLNRIRTNGVWAGTPPRAHRKNRHLPKVWQYGPEEWAVACTCGFGYSPTDEATARQYAADHHKPNFVDPRDQQEEILFTSKGEEVKVTMTDQQAAEALVRKSATGNNFARDLANGFARYNSWTARQRPWAHKLANEQVAREQDNNRLAGARPAEWTPNDEQPQVSEGHTFPRLVEILTKAKESLKYPRMVAQFDEGAIRIGLASGRSKYPGSINVTSDGSYEDRTWYGRIHTDGRFEPSRRGSPDWVVDALVKFNEDPAGAAKVQGQKYGHCCFCRKELVTNESVAAGYGPVCADHYGLPWG